MTKMAINSKTKLKKSSSEQKAYDFESWHGALPIFFKTHDPWIKHMRLIWCIFIL